MKLFPTTSVKQMELYHQKLADYERAGIDKRTAQKLAMKTAGALFKRHSRPRDQQLRWHFQGDFSGQKYLFKEQEG